MICVHGIWLAQPLPPGSGGGGVSSLSAVVTHDAVVESTSRLLPLLSPAKPLLLRVYPEGGDLVAGVPCKVYLEV